jgi:6-pyruvoyltetrahydropterin/6-carboxytetrahydropterin synthase
MFEISKTFEFSAAHSVFSQRLDSRWAKNTYPKCRRLPGHGHNYRLVVYLQSEKLDSSQMVTDFGHLRWLKEFVDECFDHKLLLSFEDPAFSVFLEKLGLLRKGRFTVPVEEARVEAVAVDRSYRLKRFEFGDIELLELKSYSFISFRYVGATTSPEGDFYSRLIDGIAFFECSPTSENLARFFYYFVNENIKPLGVKCSKVSVFETPSSCATFGKA